MWRRLIGRVAAAAIEDAGLQPAEVDAVFVGNFNGGFSRQEFPSSLPMLSVPDLRFKPAARYENACASGTSAVYAARDFIAAGRGRVALVIGVEKMTATPGAASGRHPARRLIPAGGGGHSGWLRRRVRPYRGDVFPALGGPVGRAGGDRGEEPQERRGQSIRADAQGSRLRVLPHCLPKRTPTSPGR